MIIDEEIQFRKTTRYVVMVEITANDPLHAEVMVGQALGRGRCPGTPYTRQTGYVVPNA